MNYALPLALSMTVMRLAPDSIDLGVPPSHSISGPIALVAEREATRLAAAAEPTPSDSNTVLESARSVSDDRWSRVRTLAAGTEIIVTVRGLEPGNRYLVTADDSELMVLNVSDPALPVSVRSALRHAAASHPGFLAAAQRGETFLLENDVRVARDGVFVADRKVAALTQVAERIGQHDVAEIRIAKRDANAFGCAVAAYFGGGFVGGMSGALVGGAVSRDTGGALTGMMIGWPVGAAIVYRTCRHKPEQVIYRP
jgi:hypothetical protein